MLSWLTRTFGKKAALALAAAYALCMSAIPAAIASVPEHAIHCLSDQLETSAAHHHDAAAHVHADGAAHHHDANGTVPTHSHDGAKSHLSGCCGLFCMTAIGIDSAVALGAPTAFQLSRPAVDDDLSGRRPDRIHRPPIA